MLSLLDILLAVGKLLTRIGYCFGTALKYKLCVINSPVCLIDGKFDGVKL